MGDDISFPTCPQCKGTGRAEFDWCAACEGFGKFDRNKEGRAKWENAMAAIPTTTLRLSEPTPTASDASLIRLRAMLDIVENAAAHPPSEHVGPHNTAPTFRPGDLRAALTIGDAATVAAIRALSAYVALMVDLVPRVPVEPVPLRSAEFMDQKSRAVGPDA